MKLLFGPTTGTVARETALKDTNFVQHYQSINGDILSQEVKPYIQATQDLISQLL